MSAARGDRPALYAVVDYRHDERPRVVDTFVEPSVAVMAADLLRAFGADARVELLSAMNSDGESAVA